jgi:hypothetical protein
VRDLVASKHPITLAYRCGCAVHAVGDHLWARVRAWHPRRSGPRRALKPGAAGARQAADRGISARVRGVTRLAHGLPAVVATAALLLGAPAAEAQCSGAGDCEYQDPFGQVTKPKRKQPARFGQAPKAATAPPATTPAAAPSGAPETASPPTAKPKAKPKARTKTRTAASAPPTATAGDAVSPPADAVSATPVSATSSDPPGSGTDALPFVLAGIVVLLLLGAGLRWRVVARRR